MSYKSLENNFLSYMAKEGALSENSQSNYRSWMRFIYSYSELDALSDSVEDIIRFLEENTNERKAYNSKKDIGNFRSALKKFKKFLDNTESTIDQGDHPEFVEFIKTASLQQIYARLGQGKFREDVISKAISKCFICGFDHVELLIASHIKPWKDSNDNEKLDGNNGILLLPTYDRLFDKGYISFNPQSLILEVSSKLNNSQCLNLPVGEKFSFSNSQLKYLEFHYKNVFIA